MDQLLLKGLEIVGVRGWPPQNVPQWHIDCFELK